MDTLFLDANVLFSAAYQPGSGLLRLWKRRSARLITSVYACEEARRNLPDADLNDLLESVDVSARIPDRPMPKGVDLPEKDQVILLSAIESGATHLLTGDMKHFGPYFGKAIEGVRIMRPGGYLKEGTGRKASG